MAVPVEDAIAALSTFSLEDLEFGFRPTPEQSTVQLSIAMFRHIASLSEDTEVMEKARRLNIHVFSMLKSRCLLEDKTACAIKQSGTPLHRIKLENTVCI